MENTIKDFRKNWYILPLFLVILVGYFLLRLPNLTLQPIFVDEAIYIRWAQVMQAEPTLRFLPLSDGKTPLFMWAMIPFFKVFDDPLYAGRILSVLSGFITLLGVTFLGWKFLNLRVGLWAALLLAIVPYIVFFDRMALVDSMLAAFSIWSLSLSLLLVKYRRFDLAMVLGYFLGGSLLTKPPGFFNILVLPATILLINWKSKEKYRLILELFVSWTIALLVTLVIYNLLRLGPGFDNLSTRNQDYVFSPQELQGRILDPFIPHVHDIVDWFTKLLTWPVLALMMVGLVFAAVKRNMTMVVILIWALVPMITQMVFLRTFTARYILFSIPPLLILSAWAIDTLILKLQGKYLGKAILVLAILLFATIPIDYLLLTSPEKANLPRSERRGYLEEWTAGYGLKEIAQFLIEESKSGTVVVGTEGSFGTLPDGLQIYLEAHTHSVPEDKRIAVVGGKAVVSDQIRDSAKKYKTFYVANRSRVATVPEGLKLIREYNKVKGPTFQDAILLFEVMPK